MAELAIIHNLNRKELQVALHGTDGAGCNTNLRDVTR